MKKDTSKLSMHSQDKGMTRGVKK